MDLINSVAAPRIGDGRRSSVSRSRCGGLAAYRDRACAGRRSGGHRSSRRLRSALRDLIRALIEGRPVLQGTVSDLNFLMQSAATSTRSQLTGTGLRAKTHWHREFGGSRRLAFVAAQAAEFLPDLSKAGRLGCCAIRPVR